MTDKTDTAECENKNRFNDDIQLIVNDFEDRFRRHLSDGDPVAALEARLCARLVELREFEKGTKWLIEYSGSLERIADQ